MRPPILGQTRATSAGRRLLTLGLVLVATLAVAGLPSGDPRLVSPALAADPSAPTLTADPSLASTTPSPAASPDPSPTASASPAPAPSATADMSPSASPPASPSEPLSPSPSPSPGPADSPTPSTSPTAAPSDSPTASLTPSPSASEPATPAPSPTPTPLAYGLVPKPLRPGSGTLTGGVQAAVGLTSPHTSYSLVSDACAACHRSHSATSEHLILNPAPESELCLGCHDASGTGSSLTTAAELAGIPANDPSNGLWYSHPVTSGAGHTSDAANEFAGVLNRHSTCSDCHDSHNATASRPTPGPRGWSASGAVSGASSVLATNRVGSEPTYQLVQGPTSFADDGSVAGGTSAALEYQLCFKCHSGFTKLPAHDAAPASSHPSWSELDKGVEFDPLNAKSFHPVEAPGTNGTPAMTASLSGESTYKLWNFKATDTVRCTNCHAGPATPTSGTTPDTTLPVHASAQAGILIAPYRDRLLKTSAATDGYASKDFALCYLCHAEGPMTEPTDTSASNFDGTPGAPYAASYQSLHALHMTGIQTQSTGAAGDIDTPGAGQGDALCAECHFRLHSTALAYNLTDRSNTRLVNFAPDVLPAGGSIAWTSTGVGQGSCTLTCHGYTHTGTSYGP